MPADILPDRLQTTPAAGSPPPPADARERLLRLLADGIERETFRRLVLAKPLAPAGDGGGNGIGDGDAALRVSIRRVDLHGVPHLQFVHSHPTRDITKNLALADGLQALRQLIGHAFGHAHLFDTTEEVQLLISRKGRQTLRRTAVGGGSDIDGTAAATAAKPPAPPAGHDRAKHRVVDLGRPYLAALGVTDAEHRLIPAMARKWKQINRFVEILDHALASTGLKTAPGIAVADFGSGKGYLTFALHDHLRRTLGLPAEVTGVELRADMVALCNAAAERLGLDGLRFEQGDVQTRPARQAIDIMIALHACDTATDHAIHAGVQAGAAIIMCSPCCHKELRPQLLSPHPLRPLLRHGVHLGQQAEMLTDGLRAMLLEAVGYDTRVFEFISLEHTDKNKMILAVKRSNAPGPADEGAAALWQQVRELKDFYGIRTQCLETLLLAGRTAPRQACSQNPLSANCSSFHQPARPVP